VNLVAYSMKLSEASELWPAALDLNIKALIAALCGQKIGHIWASAN